MAEGAAPPVYLAARETADWSGGCVTGRRRVDAASTTRDGKSQDRLWERSVEVTGEDRPD